RHQGRIRQCALYRQVVDHDQGQPGQQEQPTVPRGQPGPKRQAFHRAPNRYPAPGTVSITGGSPSLRRNVITATRTALVNGSACSSHAFSSSSSALTTVPSARISTVSTANSLGDSNRT